MQPLGAGRIPMKQWLLIIHHWTSSIHETKILKSIHPFFFANAQSIGRNGKTYLINQEMQRFFEMFAHGRSWLRGSERGSLTLDEGLSVDPYNRELGCWSSGRLPVLLTCCFLADGQRFGPKGRRREASR